MVINDKPSSRNRPPILMPNHIPLKQLEAGETSATMSDPFAAQS